MTAAWRSFSRTRMCFLNGCCAKSSEMMSPAASGNASQS
ncbi:hypothetical protein 2203_scaffold802_00009 [Bacteriophage sp.]|nr:hypothetical protein 2203_scaffold802_00009 [Bacteriophage sp.]